jgi:hypothetical protein
MKSLKNFVNESLTYKSIEHEVSNALSSYKHLTISNNIAISASGWELDHPNGSLTVTFWLADKDFPEAKVAKSLKDVASKHGLIVLGNGVVENDKKSQNWNNKDGMKADYVASFELTTKHNSISHKVFKKSY